MSPDEKAIRQVVADWMAAAQANDLDQLGALMADDVVFLRPGHAPLKGRDSFLALSRQNQAKVRVEGRAEPQEICVEGSLAYLWNRLELTITPLDGGPAFAKGGDILSVFRKLPSGRWVLARDANLFAQ